MVARLGLLLTLVTMVWSCSHGDEKAKEPVAAQELSKVPDAPGSESGEGAAKAAGSGVAEAAAAEKTQPTPAPVEAPKPEGHAYTASANLHVRKGPSTKQAVVRSLKKGDSVTAESCEKHWCKVGDGEFVSEKYLTPAG